MALLEGFTDAAQRHHHYQWIDALLPFSLKPPVDCPIDTSSLLASVCSEDREALIIKYMNSDRVLFSAVDCEHRWSDHLSRSILQQLKRDLDKKRYKESNLIQLFYYFAPHLAPSTYREAAALLPKIDAATNRSSIRNEAALNFLKLRHDMLEAI
jgi:hypothetical protein